LVLLTNEPGIVVVIFDGFNVKMESLVYKKTQNLKKVFLMININLSRQSKFNDFYSKQKQFLNQWIGKEKQNENFLITLKAKIQKKVSTNR